MEPGAHISDNPALHRFELHDGGETAFLLYSKSGNSIRLIHTEVPDALRGKGIASKLVTAALRLADEQRLKVIPLCPFVIDYLKRHPEDLSIIDPEYRRMI